MGDIIIVISWLRLYRTEPEATHSNYMESLRSIWGKYFASSLFNRNAMMGLCSHFPYIVLTCPPQIGPRCVNTFHLLPLLSRLFRPGDPGTGHPLGGRSIRDRRNPISRRTAMNGAETGTTPVESDNFSGGRRSISNGPFMESRYHSQGE